MIVVMRPYVRSTICLMCEYYSSSKSAYNHNLSGNSAKDLIIVFNY